MFACPVTVICNQYIAFCNALPTATENRHDRFNLASKSKVAPVYECNKPDAVAIVAFQKQLYSCYNTPDLLHSYKARFFLF